MPRINIDDLWLIDPRREALADSVGDKDTADGVAFRFWRLAQGYDNGIIPSEIFKIAKRSKELASAGLAREIDGVGFYVCGAIKYHEWLDKFSEGRKKGGLARAATGKRGEFGRFAPAGNQLPAGQLDQLPSSSSSSSSSSSKINTISLKADKTLLSADGEWVGLEKKVVLWKNLFPAINVDLELKKAAAWLLANPKNKKSNYDRFLVNWFSRTQDKAPRTEKNTSERFPGREPDFYNQGET